MASATTRDLQYELNKMLTTQRKITESADGYNEAMKEVKSLTKEINLINGNILKQQIKVADAALAYQNNASQANKDALDNENYKLKYLNKELAARKKILHNLKAQVKEAHTLNVMMKSSLKDVVAIKTAGYQIVNKFNSWNIFAMTKSIKTSALQMGVLSQQAESFSRDIQMAASQTVSFGVGIEDIAKIQATYSEELGRTVMLGSKGAEALAEMSVAAGLGAEGASTFAAQMENVGVSAEKVRDFLGQTLDDAHAMGLNASKVIKNISNNIKLLNRYNFKEGINGLAKMAESTTKMGIEMDSVGSMAEKLFNIEGAVEMSAQLQVLGGQWAKLADPFKLMYMARNDMDGLAKSVIEATKDTAKFNATTKEFDLSSIAMQTLRQVAEATGLNFEELAKSAKNAAKFSKIKSQIGFGFDAKTKEFIESTAMFDERGKAMIKVNFGEEPKYLSALSQSEKTSLIAMAAEKASMRKRAEESITFDEKINNTLTMFKQLLVPILEQLNTKLGPIVDRLVKQLQNKEFLDKIMSFAKTVGNAIAAVGEFIVKWPKLTLGLFGLFELGKWVANGIALGTGFNGVASVGGAAGGIFGKSGSLTFGKSLMQGMKGGLIGAVVAGGLELGRNQLDDRNSNAGKAMGVGSTAAAYAGTGALIGSIIPGVGTGIGAAVGGVAGLAKGLYDEFAAGSTQVNDGIVQFNQRDKFMKVNDSTMIAGTNENGNKKLAQTLSGQVPGFKQKDDLMKTSKNPVTNTVVPAAQPSIIRVEFGELKLGGSVDLRSGDGVSSELGKELLKNPSFVREISRIVHIQTESAVKGKTSGK